MHFLSFRDLFRAAGGDERFRGGLIPMGVVWVVLWLLRGIIQFFCLF